MIRQPPPNVLDALIAVLAALIYLTYGADPRQALGMILLLGIGYAFGRGAGAHR